MISSGVRAGAGGSGVRAGAGGSGVEGGLPADVSFEHLTANGFNGFNYTYTSTFADLHGDQLGGDRQVDFFATCGRRDSPESGSGIAYIDGQFFSSLGRLTFLNNRCNVIGVDRTVTTMALGSSYHHLGVGAADSFSAFCCNVISPGYELKQRKFLPATTTSTPSVTFDSVVGADSSVVVCLHHNQPNDPVSTPPTGGVFLSSHIQNNTQIGGVSMWTFGQGLVGLSAVPGPTLSGAVPCSVVACEYGPV